MGLYEELLQNHDAKLIAGGAAQNTARGAQVNWPKAFLASFGYLPRTVHAAPKLRGLRRLRWQR